MKRKLVVFISVMLLVLVLITTNLGAAPIANSSSEDTVYAISVEKAVEAGLSSYMQRAIKTAIADPTAQAVILEIDTPGGAITAAQEIRKTIESCPLPTIALVKGSAISAGTYIAMSCDVIAMQPGTTIGDVEPRIGKERADEKYLSYWKAEMAALAEAHGRDVEIAKAMVDRDMVLPGQKEAGKLLTLTAQEAQSVGYADYLVANRAELKEKLDVANATDKEIATSRGERIARFLTNPVVAPILLMIGLAGIFIEIFTIGFGLAGLVGGASLALYFGGHLFAGFTGWGTLLIFFAGIILLLMEIAMPGFGVAGVSGIICLGAAIVITAPDLQVGLQSLVIAIIGTVILLMVAFKLLTKRKFWDRLVLSLKFDKEKGYISQKQSYTDYLGKQAKTITDLRPAGIVVLEDGTRLDVVSEGAYVEKGEEVIISQVDGMRIVVNTNHTPQA
jgi:membrane-bound serine protease (ClpP class)